MHLLQIKIKPLLYSPYYAQACNELRGPSSQLSTWATQLRTPEKTSQRWQAVGDSVSDLTSAGIEPQTSRTASNVATTTPNGLFPNSFSFCNARERTCVKENSSCCASNLKLQFFFVNLTAVKTNFESSFFFLLTADRIRYKRK